MYGFDHVYPGSGGRQVVVALYGQMGTRAFLGFHPALARLAAQGELTYLVRHFIKVGNL